MSQKRDMGHPRFVGELSKGKSKGNRRSFTPLKGASFRMTPF
jgi:hypothetical protein